jgi:hypothetical protein
MLLSALPLALLFFEAAAPDFRASVNGAGIDLHAFEGGAFGRFELARAADVEIRTAFDLRWVDIRPKSAGIVPIIERDRVRFKVPRPIPLTIEFNGEWKKVVHLFADTPERDAPKQGDPNVRYFEPGNHTPGIIELTDGQTLYLAPGAWVQGAVRSVGTRNISIRGRGVLDGSLYQKRHNVIYLERTEGARVEGVTLFNSLTWTLYVKHSRGTRIDGIRIVNYRTGTDGIDLVASSDVSVENVFVRANDDCVVVKTWDDVPVRDIVVRKAVFWNMPWGNAVEVGFELRAPTVEKIRFEDIDIIRVERGAALSIHNGDFATVRDVVFDNIRIEDARHKLIDLAIVYGRYGADKPTEEERVKRSMRGAWDGVLRYPPEEHAERAKHRGQIRDIVFSNIHVVDGMLPFSLIAGFDKEHAVENVLIKGLTLYGKPVKDASDGKFSIEHARGIRFEP